MAQKSGHDDADFNSLPEILPLPPPRLNQLRCSTFTTSTPDHAPADLDLLTEKTAVSMNVKRDVMKRVVNRCTGCKRKVGLTGFRCRCGHQFCSVHRYSDRHDCRYDYKAAGREAIARENPVVKAVKLIKVWLSMTSSVMSSSRPSIHGWRREHCLLLGWNCCYY